MSFKSISDVYFKLVLKIHIKNPTLYDLEVIFRRLRSVHFFFEFLTEHPINCLIKCMFKCVDFISKPFPCNALTCTNMLLCFEALLMKF